MDQDLQNHIRHHLLELINFTDCNCLFRTHLIANGVLGAQDVESLRVIKNRFDRSELFYQIIVTRSNAYEHLLGALEETCQSGAAEILKQKNTASSNEASKQKLSASEILDSESNIIRKKPKLIDSSISPVKSISFDVQSPTILFTGRQSNLKELHDLLQHPTGTSLVTQVAASVTGLGGIGKSELCRAYISQHREYYDGNIVWINSENQGSMIESFKRLAKDVLKITTKDANGTDKSPKSIADDVYNFFLSSRSLFVFDNVEEGDHLDFVLPTRVSKPPHILITSRCRNWGFETKILVLHEFTEEEAIQFVKLGLKIIKYDDEGDLIKKLVDKLQRFPLALKQAISYIDSCRQVASYTIQQYLEDFEVNSKVPLSAKLSGSFDSYKETTYTTWRITAKTIASDKDHGREAIRILNFMAYLAADRIPLNLISSLLNIEERRTIEPFKLLVKYSMVDSQPKEGNFSIHRLVQEVIRLDLRENKLEESTLQQILSIFVSKLKDKSVSVSHVLSAFTFVKGYPNLVKEYSSLPGRILKRLHDNHMLKEFHHFEQTSLALLQKYLGDDHAHVMKIQFEYAALEYSQKKYSDSLRGFQHIHDIMIKNKGQRYAFQPHEIQHYIARILRRQGMFRECLEILQSVHSETLARLGENNKRTIDVTHHCAKLQKDLGNYSEAMTLYVNVIDGYVKLFGESHKQVLVAQHNLSMLHFNMGRLDLAISLSKSIYDKVKRLAIEDKSFLQNHTILHNYAYLLCVKGDYEEAYDIARQVHELKVKAVGGDADDNVDVLLTLNVIGNIKTGQGKYDEALLIHDKIYRKVKQQSGSEDQEVLKIKLDIAIVWSKIGMCDDAIACMREILSLQINAHGPIHHFVFHIKLEIAKVLEKMKQYQGAITLYKDVGNNLRDTFGDKHFRLCEIEESITRIQNITAVQTCETKVEII